MEAMEVQEQAPPVAPVVQALVTVIETMKTVEETMVKAMG